MIKQKMDFHFVLSVCVLYLSCFDIVTCRATGEEQRIRPKTQGQTISFLNEDGDTCAKERVMVTDTEARFDVQGQMSYVFDYEQQQLIFKELTKGAPCYLYTGFDTASIPTPDELRNLLAENNVFKMPTERYEINLQKSRVQPLIRPSLSPVSRKLCQNSQVVLLEPKTFVDAGASAVAERRLRPKRDVGWGEVVVIIIVIIILL